MILKYFHMKKGKYYYKPYFNWMGKLHIAMEYNGQKTHWTCKKAFPL